LLVALLHVSEDRIRRGLARLRRLRRSTLGDRDCRK
jgi:hypothetical protein